MTEFLRDSEGKGGLSRAWTSCEKQSLACELLDADEVENETASLCARIRDVSSKEWMAVSSFAPLVPLSPSELCMSFVTYLSCRFWPTKPCALGKAVPSSLRPRPLMCECVAILASREAPDVELSIVTGPPPGTAAAETLAVAMLARTCLWQM